MRKQSPLTETTAAKYEELYKFYLKDLVDKREQKEIDLSKALEGWRLPQYHHRLNRGKEETQYISFHHHHGGTLHMRSLTPYYVLKSSVEGLDMWEESGHHSDEEEGVRRQRYQDEDDEDEEEEEEKNPYEGPHRGLLPTDAEYYSDLGYDSEAEVSEESEPEAEPEPEVEHEAADDETNNEEDD